jgi:hypothetical protein
VSLFLDLRVTLVPGVSESVGFMQIRRLHELDLAKGDDAVSTYEVRADGEVRGTVSHRYGDGPWVLLQKALERHLGAAAHDEPVAAP